MRFSVKEAPPLSLAMWSLAVSGSGMMNLRQNLRNDGVELQNRNGTLLEMNKDRVLDLVARQLMYYEMTDVARQVWEATGSTATMDASNQLADLVRQSQLATATSDYDQLGPHLQSEDFQVVSTSLRPADRPAFQSRFNTAHKMACTTACFSADGRYIATGSQDTSLKVLDVARIMAISPSIPPQQIPMEDRPVIRTFYDHVEPVNEVLFHPNGRALASCSDDCLIKLYDLQRVGMKRAFRHLQDSHPVRSISFHPSGDYILAGTDDENVHLFDILTMKCFVPVRQPDEVHTGGITAARYGPHGDFYITAGVDGVIRIWDGVSSQLTRKIDQAHGGASVKSVIISRNGRFILSCGEDGDAKLWEIGSGKLVMTYKGGAAPAGRAVFSWNESMVVATEKNTPYVSFWCSRTGKHLDRMHSQSAVLETVAYSPTEDAMVTCSSDNRVRFWSAMAED